MKQTIEKTTFYGTLLSSQWHISWLEFLRGGAQNEISLADQISQHATVPSH